PGGRPQDRAGRPRPVPPLPDVRRQQDGDPTQSQPWGERSADFGGRTGRCEACAMTTDAADFLAIDALLSDEERLLRDTVRQFVQDRVLPDVADWFDVGTFPKEMAKEM